MKLIFTIGILYCFCFSMAQEPTLQLFESKMQYNYSRLSNPKLLGKVGHNYMITDVSVRGSTLSIFDSSFQFIQQTEQLPVFYRAFKHITGDSLQVSWNEFHTDEEWLCLQSFDQNGKSSPVRKLVINNPQHKLMSLVTDKACQKYFFYTLLANDSPNIVIEGVLLDANWQKLKDISGSFQLHSALEGAPVPIVDVAGNIHLFVYDKLSNYRLSASLTINTLPFRANDFQKEVFRFDNIKVYDPVFSDDTSRQSILMNDFFYDGQTKFKKGIVSIQIPYKRGKGIVSVLKEMPDSIQQKLRSETRNLRARQPLMESVVTTEIFQPGNAVFFLTDLLDLPLHQLVRDTEVEPMARSHNRVRYRYDRPGRIGSTTTRISGAPPSTSQQLAAGAPIFINSNSRVVNPIAGQASTQVLKNTQNAELAPKPQDRSTNTGSEPNSNGKQSPAVNTGVVHAIPVSKNEKRAVFFIDDRGQIQWCQYLSPDAASLKFSLDFPYSYPMLEENGGHFLHYDITGIKSVLAENGEDEILLRFTDTHIRPEGLRQYQADINSERGVKLHWPILLPNGKYLMPYTNMLKGRSGLALLHLKGEMAELQ